MLKMNLRAAVGASTLALGFALLLPTMAHAQTACNGTLSGTYFNDIVVNGGACTLDGATTTGSVLVSNGGTLTTLGATQISGDIQANNGGNINLDSVTLNGPVILLNSQNVTVGAGVALNSLSLTGSGSATLNGAVNGPVSLLNSQNVTVGAGATVNSLSLANSGDLNASGSIGTLLTNDSGAISLTGATIPGGVNVSQGSGAVTICAGTVITGGVSMIERNGSLLVGATTGCGVSTINGSITVEKGTGDVQFIGTLLEASDLSVVEQTGNVVGNGAAFSDVKVEKLTGSVTLTAVTTDSDTTLADISGPVSITSSALGSDVGINTDSAVTLTGNDFSLEDIFISGGSGSVVVSNNTNLSFAVTERNNVTISGNNFTSASITKNTGGVSIVNNTGETLLCSDNNPAPTGSGNTITILADGQCTGF